MTHEEQIERWAERAMDVLDHNFKHTRMTQGEYEAEARLIKIVADDAMKNRIHEWSDPPRPQDYESLSEYTEAFVSNELARYERISPETNYGDALRVLHGRSMAALDAAATARELWERR